MEPGLFGEVADSRDGQGKYKSLEHLMVPGSVQSSWAGQNNTGAS